MVKKQHPTGLLEDTRTSKEKLKDYQAREVLSAFTPAEWREKKSTEWKRFPIFNQDGSSSCVGQAVSKALGIENHKEEGEFIHLSARDIYSQRSNYPREGMIYVNAMDIAVKKGATLEQLMPSQKKPEAEMNKRTDDKIYKQQVAQIFRASGYVQLPFEIDAIASILQTGKPVLLGQRFNYAEWKDVPLQQSTRPLKLGHAITAVDFTLYKGKKHIVIEDSWGEFGAWAGQRLLSESWIAERTTFAGYFLDLNNNWRDGGVQPTKPRHTFSVAMRFGETNEQVKKLQEVLRYEELFPATTEITGYYGSITAKGVLAFQKRYSVASPEELDTLAGRVCGDKTLAKLNEIYS